MSFRLYFQKEYQLGYCGCILLQKLFVIIVLSILITSIIPSHGAPLGFDKKSYTWTDKIFITIIAPDYNFDKFLIDEIGNDSFNPIKISTRGHTLDHYKLVETGPNTGIFTGEIILTGFCHDADGNSETGLKSNSKCKRGDDTNPKTEPFNNGGPTDGFIETDNDDGITISFEYNENYTVLGSAPIKWNIGEVQWLESNYPTRGVGVVRVIDPDMNLNPEAVDNFKVDIWSDSDSGGIDLTVTETGEMTGIFEGTVFFTDTDESSGSRLRAVNGNLVTAKYDDNTLPSPYTTADDLGILGTVKIGTLTSEMVLIENTRITDTSEKTLNKIFKNQSIQIVSDLQNNQSKNQIFSYIVQIKDSNGIIQHLAWISGSLTPAQRFSSALSWIPQNSGNYEVTSFVWESMDNPISLSSPTSLLVNVN